MSETNKTKLFLPYNHRDAVGLANGLRTDLEKHGYEVLQDTGEIRKGQECAERFAYGQPSTKMISALCIPRSVRRVSDSIQQTGELR